MTFSGYKNHVSIRNIDLSLKNISCQSNIRLLDWMKVALISLSAVSCSMVPSLREDDFAVPSQFKERQGVASSTPKKNSADGSSVLETVNAMKPLKGSSVLSTPEELAKGGALSELGQSNWWEQLGDPLLNEWQEQVLKRNVSLLQLSTQVRVAQASLKQAEASLFPTLNLNMSSSRAANQLSVPKGTSYSLSAPMSWELDVWGRIDALTQVAKANAVASELDLRQAKVSAQALLVQTYITWITARGQASLLERTVKVYEKSLALTQARYRSGVVSSADVAQAKTQLSSTQAQWQDIVLQRKQIEHALAVLLGLAPAQLSAKEKSSPLSSTVHQPMNHEVLKPLPPIPALPEVLVLDVLQFRPDIQAAKRRVEAANAQLGVARAAFFPPLVLSASAGYRNTDLATLISAPNQAWSIGPSLVLPLIDGGLRQAAKDSAQAQLDNAVLAYRQVVLNAFQEIEDNLAAREQLDLIQKSWTEAVQSAAKNLDVTLAQYQSGVVPYLNVISAQSAYLGAQRSLLDVESRRLLAWNILMKSTFVSNQL